MRTTRIITAVIALFLMGSTPVASLNVPGADSHRGAAVCPVATYASGAISLVGSQGAFGIVPLASQTCGE